MTRQTPTMMVAILLASPASVSAAIEPLATLPSPVAATPAAGAPPSSANAPMDAWRHVAAATPVAVELGEEVSTKRQKRGDTFAIRLAEAIVVDGRTLIPAGAAGGGEVVDAAPGGIAGRPAKLILAARYLAYNGVRIPLRGFRLAGTGRDNADTVSALSAVPYVGIFAIAISGGNVVFPAGMRGVAKVASDTDLPALLPTPPAQDLRSPGTKP